MPASATELVRSLRAMVAQPFLEAERAIIDELMPDLDHLVVPAAIVHGDFAPWNVRLSASRIRAFDWEWASSEGLPLIDSIHHRLQVGFLLGGWSSEHAFASLVSMAAERPLGLDPGWVYRLQAVSLTNYLVRMTQGSEKESSVLAAKYRDLLARVARILRESPITVAQTG
jgi:hypothetical protein